MNAQLKDSAATRARPPPFNPFAHRTPAVPNGELPDDGLDPTPMTPADQIYAHFGVVPLSANLATHFKLEVMQEAARDAMMISNVKAYTRDTQERSLFRMVMVSKSPFDLVRKY
ncbi:hypothetical protein PtB15_3B890 [Puccinia triticina]|nr:hypothetical protein PtB15_3B890 [Puccinia triticina]